MNQTLDLFLERLAARNRLYWPSVQDNLRRNEPLFRDVGGRLVGWAAAHLGERYADVLVEGYGLFVTDVNRSQMAYERRGAYEAKSYAEVYASVYGAAEAMSTYHWGVYVTTFAWEHHLRLCRFFADEFLARLGERGAMVDLGAGSGVWHLMALDRLPSWTAHAIDISQTSVDIAGRMAAAAGFAARTSHEVGDATAVRRDQGFAAGISCFLLEHLEQPGALLANLAANLEPHAYAFVTAALTAAERDHITEFRRESEVCALAEAAGFRVVSTYSAAPTTYPTSCKFLPRSMALVLQKRAGEIW